jgi:hypothetical protein
MFHTIGDPYKTCGKLVSDSALAYCHDGCTFIHFLADWTTTLVGRCNEISPWTAWSYSGEQIYWTDPSGRLMTVYIRGEDSSKPIDITPSLLIDEGMHAIRGAITSLHGLILVTRRRHRLKSKIWRLVNPAGGGDFQLLREVSGFSVSLLRIGGTAMALQPNHPVDGVVTLTNLDNGAIEIIQLASTRVIAPSFSADAKSCVFTQTLHGDLVRTVFLRRETGNESILSVTGYGSCAPSGMRLAIVENHGGVVVVDCDKTCVEHPVISPKHPPSKKWDILSYRKPTWSYDERFLVFSVAELLPTAVGVLLKGWSIGDQSLDASDYFGAMTYILDISRNSIAAFGQNTVGWAWSPRAIAP